ncbi:CBASS oligonucleotide cyclase [Curtobacterium sp. VKM Ac-1395]|uniref:CBASS oligonucleotide cyclase n=1 Tax=Curtobacterium sp. VKM Ac-1395 TaxID=2783815 RepID=UPI00188A550D|nr:CBASS oligonucleotide cyclase [Curtobacterium sp. VKM Ac-1395]MBF4592012.1 hypothetical protein [Curtobacterium sp. VKM Ac-1395]
MGAVDDAFARLKATLEITDVEASTAAKRHRLIRDHIRERWDLEDDFLTGSYDRHTKTKKLKDVDVFVVIDPDGPQGSLADGTGYAAIAALRDILAPRWEVETDDVVARIVYSAEEVASYEIAPAFATTDGYLIPNGNEWMETNPSIHADLVTAKNQEFGGIFVPLVKMLKGINREYDEPIQPSFLLEVMALDLCIAPAQNYANEVQFFLAGAADAVRDDWADPAHLGDDVNKHMSPADRESASRMFTEWNLIAENAIALDEAGHSSEAVNEWRSLFGNRMPKR